MSGTNETSLTTVSAGQSVKPREAAQTASHPEQPAPQASTVPQASVATELQTKTPPADDKGGDDSSDDAQAENPLMAALNRQAENRDLQGLCRRAEEGLRQTPPMPVKPVISMQKKGWRVPTRVPLCLWRMPGHPARPSPLFLRGTEKFTSAASRTPESLSPPSISLPISRFWMTRGPVSFRPCPASPMTWWSRPSVCSVR